MPVVDHLRRTRDLWITLDMDVMLVTVEPAWHPRMWRIIGPVKERRYRDYVFTEDVDIFERERDALEAAISQIEAERAKLLKPLTRLRGRLRSIDG